MLAVLFVAPLFYGYWSLDNVALLSPVEVALAFDAPLVKGASSATGARGVISKMGEVEVKYGAVRQHAGGLGEVKGSDSPAYRLGISRSESVTTPMEGMRFDH